MALEPKRVPFDQLSFKDQAQRLHSVYYTYVAERRVDLEEYLKGVQENLDPSTMAALNRVYGVLYGCSPLNDDFFNREEPNYGAFMEKLLKGDGKRLNLPILVEGQPLAISSYQISLREEDLTATLQIAKKSPNPDALRNFIIEAQTDPSHITDLVFTDVGFQRSDGTLKSIGRSDFYVNEFGEKKDADGYIYGKEILGGLIDSTIDRSLVKGAHVPFQVASPVLRNAGLRGLGRMIFALGLRIAGMKGVETRYVHDDLTYLNPAHGASFYINEMNAQFTMRQNGPVPYFKTDQFTVENRLNGFAGYWLPTK